MQLQEGKVSVDVLYSRSRSNMGKKFLGTKLAVLSLHRSLLPHRVVSIVKLNPTIQLSISRQQELGSSMSSPRSTFCIKSNSHKSHSAVVSETSTPSIRGEISDVTEFIHHNYVHVIGRGKGHGFAGVVSRHGFGRGPMTRGSNHHRAPGSIGAGTFPARVYPKKKMPGLWAVHQRTYKNIRTAKLDVGLGLVWLEGNVPGKKGNSLSILPAGQLSDDAGNQT